MEVLTTFIKELILHIQTAVDDMFSLIRYQHFVLSM